jgi:hypothetical protein
LFLAVAEDLQLQGQVQELPVLVLLLVEVFPDKLILFNHNNFLGYDNE